MYKKIYSSGDMSKVVYQNNIIWRKKYIWKKYRVIGDLTEKWVIKRTKMRYVIKVYATKIYDGKYKAYADYEIVNNEIIFKNQIQLIYANSGLGTKGDTVYSVIDNKQVEGKVGEGQDSRGRRMQYINFTDYISLEKEPPNVSKGSYVSEVVSYNKNEYPDNGLKDGYWYEKVN